MMVLIVSLFSLCLIHNTGHADLCSSSILFVTGLGDYSRLRAGTVYFEVMADRITSLKKSPS